MLTYLAFIILAIVVVSSFVLGELIMSLYRFVSNEITKNQELINLRDIHHKKVFNEIILALNSVNEIQESLREQIVTLSRFVDERITYVFHQQEQFKAFAKSDMLSARRDELIRANELKVALERIMSMTTMSRQAPAAVDLLALESVTNRIKELEVILESE